MRRIATAAMGVLALGALIAIPTVVKPLSAATTVPPDALEVMWQDFCDRMPTHPKCLTPSIAPTASTTPTATPSPSASPSPTPTAAPSPTATATPTAAPTASASPPAPNTYTVESQAWWNRDGIEIPEAVGHHVHVQATIPSGIVNGTIDIPVKLTLHDQVGTTNWLRLQAVTPSGSNVERWQQDVTMGPCHDCTENRTIRVDVTGWPTGRHELRISLNVPDEQPDVSGAQRMFQSTGWQLCVRSCTPAYRDDSEGNPIPFIEARGWYDDTPTTGERGYQNARLTTPLASVRSGGAVGVRLGPGADGLPTTFSGVYIDPNFHAGSAGTVVQERNGPYTGNVTFPTLPAGAHSLVLVTSDGLNAGVLRIPFEVK